MVHPAAYLGTTPEIAHPQRCDRERDSWNLIPIALAIGFLTKKLMLRPRTWSSCVDTPEAETETRTPSLTYLSSAAA